VADALSALRAAETIGRTLGCAAFLDRPAAFTSRLSRRARRHNLRRDKGRTMDARRSDELGPKLTSKMTVAGLLAGFNFAALLELVKDPDKLKLDQLPSWEKLTRAFSRDTFWSTITPMFSWHKQGDGVFAALRARPEIG
jgi:hypothetical protein